MAIVWHNSSTGETQHWLMNGHKVTGRATILGEDRKPAFVGPPWSIVATENFPLVGPTIVWYNSSTGETQFWAITGHRVESRSTVLGEDGTPALVGPPWSIVAAGHSGSDKYIVWHNSSTGETQLWFIHINQITRRATVLGEDGKPALVGLPWSIVSCGDLHANGTTDLVWHNSSTNETQLWSMNGHQVTGRATVNGEDGRPAFVGPPWSIVAAEPSNIVWHNSLSNETQLWLMNGHKVTGRATVLGEDGTPAFVGPPWNIVAAGDFPPESAPLPPGAPH